MTTTLNVSGVSGTLTDLNVHLRPKSNVVLVRIDMLDLPQRDQVRGGYVRLLDAADQGKELKRFNLAPFIESFSDSHASLERNRSCCKTIANAMKPIRRSSASTRRGPAEASTITCRCGHTLHSRES